MKPAILMPFGAAGHHKDLSPSELVASLAPLDPSEKRGFVHVWWLLRVHERLIMTHYSSAMILKKERSDPF